MNISGITPIAPILPSSTDAAESSPGGAAFHSAFTDAVAKVEGFQQNAQMSVDKFLSGEGEDIHNVALATQQADLSFDLFLQVRNKVVAAYDDIMRMQI